jgi:glycosyltransferase involved in cell wall biosynthesis
MKSILILLHSESNTGYAIGPLEATFFRMAMALCDQDRSRIHFAYPSMARGPSESLPADFAQYVVIDAATSNREECERAERYIRQHHIDTIFGFDQPVSRPIYPFFRKGGVKTFISYWGAPMSSIFGVVKRTLKRLEVALRRHGPDHYIFESHGMADTAVLGRGIPRHRTTVIHLGVDTHRFHPDARDSGYVYEHLDIPGHRRVFFYAGHFEPRKGVAVIMRAANRLARQRPADDWHIALFGNQPGEEAPYAALLTPEARSRVTFGGYRPDLQLIQRGCYAAIIASTGWDSFPRSAMEMQASGLPLLASSLPGLRESVAEGESGFLFAPGDDEALSTQMKALLEDLPRRESLSLGARARVEREFSLDAQLQRLIATVARHS